MTGQTHGENRRILVIDDNPAIHQDFRKILCAGAPQGALPAEAALFGEASPDERALAFVLDSAYQGEQGAELVRKALESRSPYAVAFVDARMPPGWDGIETIARIWQYDPHVQIVICTAYADYSWAEIRNKLIHTDRFVILKKPFDPIEVLQLADSLSAKWCLAVRERRQLHLLEQQIADRNRDLQAMRTLDARLDAANGSFAAASTGSPEGAAAGRILCNALQQEMNRALHDGEFTLHYQPLVDIASRRIVSLEALLRWKHPVRGLVPPAEFIPAAEASGLIVGIGEFVLNAVCEQLARWTREDIPVVPVAVNVSAVQLQNQDIGQLVGAVLRATGISPHCLALELTESTFMANAVRHVETFQALRRAGIRIEIDDFGTGYSSLSTLKHLPLDALKIDRSFITDLSNNPTDQAIVGAIIAMARSLELQVVAEGVETPEQLRVLGQRGCSIAQGYYFCRPSPPEHCRDLLQGLTHHASFTDTLRLQLMPPEVSAERST